MADDWQVGDLALCLKGGTQTQTGACYTVRDVSFVGDFHDGYVHLPEHDYPLLRFVGVNHAPRGWANSCRFIKVTPQSEDAFDREVTDHMAGQEVDA